MYITCILHVHITCKLHVQVTCALCTCIIYIYYMYNYMFDHIQRSYIPSSTRNQKNERTGVGAFGGMGARSGATVLVHTCTLSCNRTERGDAANPDLNFETEHGDAT